MRSNSFIRPDLLRGFDDNTQIIQSGNLILISGGAAAGGSGIANVTGVGSVTTFVSGDFTVISGAPISGGNGGGSNSNLEGYYIRQQKQFVYTGVYEETSTTFNSGTITGAFELEPLNNSQISLNINAMGGAESNAFWLGTFFNSGVNLASGLNLYTTDSEDYFINTKTDQDGSFADDLTVPIIYTFITGYNPTWGNDYRFGFKTSVASNSVYLGRRHTNNNYAVPTIFTITEYATGVPVVSGQLDGFYLKQQKEISIDGPFDTNSLTFINVVSGALDNDVDANSYVELEVESCIASRSSFLDARISIFKDEQNLITGINSGFFSLVGQQNFQAGAFGYHAWDYNPTGNHTYSLRVMKTASNNSNIITVGGRIDNGAEGDSPIIIRIKEWGSGIPYVTNNTQDYYSESEVLIGEWLGKPLYRKLLNIGNLPNATTATIAHNISGAPQSIKRLYGHADDGSFMLPLPYAGNTFITLFADNTDLSIVAETNRSSYTGYVAMEYTK